MSDRSLYQVESRWTNDAARPMKLAELSGRPQVVAMFFASCEYACPILVNEMKRIETALPPSLMTNTGFILVTFDTVRDTPSALRAYRERLGLGERWTLLRGSTDDVQELAMLLGVKFKADARGNFSHSNLITVLNAHGEIAFQQAGLNHAPAGVVRAVERSSAPLTR